MDHNTFNLEDVNCLRDLEIARHNIIQKAGEKNNKQEEMSNRFMLLDWKGTEEDEEGFTPVISRSRKIALRARNKVIWRGTHTSSGVASRGARSRCSAASVKVNNYHPLCDVVTGTMERKKPARYL